MPEQITIVLQLDSKLTKDMALAQALRYPSIRKWQDDGGTVYEYSPESGIARFPVPA
jgi:hypothetical protein